MRTISTLFVALASCFMSYGQSERLQQYLEMQHKRMHFSGTVLVTKNGAPLYQVSIGNASQELNVPIGPGSVFRIASISKQFTAMLVALAAGEGRLQLTDSLATFFPQLPDPQWRRITLHELLSHTSGVPHNEGITDYWTVTSRLPLSKEQALAAIFSMKLLFTPGTDRKYSSPGYFLLAGILETVYKRAYAQLLTEKILRPLHMTHTGVYVTGNIVRAMVAGYHLLSDSMIAAPHRDFSLMKGSGDLYSTAEDLAKWNNSFSSVQTWNDTLQKLLFTAHAKNLRHTDTAGISVKEKGWPIITAAGHSDAPHYRPGIPLKRSPSLF